MPAAEKRVFTLLQVNRSIARAVAGATGGRSFWVRAEIAQIRENGGHAYLELVQQEGERHCARARAVIWRDDLARVRRDLGAEADGILAQGSEIQGLMDVGFHVVYGLKLRILEVDLDFSLGRLERRKRETLEALEKQGLLRRNATHELAAVVQRLAVVGAPDSAGFADFVRQLLHNERGYRFGIDLFRARVQGERAPAELVRGLREAAASGAEAIVLLRGGGSRLDLDVFNDRTLGETIACLPVPVITGIGHETDHTVADTVAHTFCRTPTAAAEFLLDRAREFEEERRTAWMRIAHLARRLTETEHKLQAARTETWGLRAAGYTRLRRGDLHQLAGRITREVRRFQADRSRELQIGRNRLERSAVDLLRQREPVKLDGWTRDLRRNATHRLTAARTAIETFRARIRQVHPDQVLRQGYAVARKDGKAVGPATPLAPGDRFELELAGRRVDSRVEKVRPKPAPADRDGRDRNTAPAAEPRAWTKN